MRPRKPAIRTCIGCGKSEDKREITRFVRTPEGAVEIDETGKANGRGAYVHATIECFELAIRKRKVASALRASVNEDDIGRLRADFERVLGHQDALVNEDGDA
jgi:predicted RNA-binding protein YlxR (DUF448 family)